METWKIALIAGLVIFGLYGYTWFPTTISKLLNNKFTLLLIFGTAIYIVMSDRLLGVVLICVLLYLLLIDSKIVNNVITNKLDQLIQNTEKVNVEQTATDVSDTINKVVDAVADTVSNTVNKVSDLFKYNQSSVENFMIFRDGKYVFPYDGKMKELELDDSNMSNL
jgi:hypothetical protein